ncbi:MAG: hypothetical protein KC440_09055 [Nitrosarchaeum sp.]|nr:hypothetical protein [Nitrosarchaeum sp.]
MTAEKMDIEKITLNYKIHKIIGQYTSALEHTFLWIVNADNTHMIQQFCIDSRIASFNSV